MQMRAILYIFFTLIPITNLCNHRQAISDDFDIVFQQNLDKTPTGIYSRNQWSKDWGNPPWANGIYTGDLTIIDDFDLGGRSSRAMKWSFPEGSFGANSSHGYQWHTPLGEKYEEIYLSYSLMFKPGFEPVLGGKIPGLQASPIKVGIPERRDGFGGSLMFKEGPKPVFYIYHHDQQGEYGDTREWDYVFNVSSDTWYDITFRVVMNTASTDQNFEDTGKKDGIMEGFVNGRLVGQWTGLRLRNISDIGTDVLRIQAFFGGSTEEWASDREEWMLIDNVFVWTYSDKYLTDHPQVKRGRQVNTKNAELYTPIDAFLSEDSR